MTEAATRRGVAPGRRILRRRGLLVVAAASAATGSLSGCDLLSEGEEAAPGDSASRERDRELALDAIAVETALIGLIEPLTRSGPADQRRRAQAALVVHRRHLDLLGEAAPGPSPGAPGRASRRRAMVARAEERALRRHADAAVRAASGPFARVLAGMSAASAQQVEIWRA